jgi:hypothetical protein
VSKSTLLKKNNSAESPVISRQYTSLVVRKAKCTGSWKRPCSIAKPSRRMCSLMTNGPYSRALLDGKSSRESAHLMWRACSILRRDHRRHLWDSCSPHPREGAAIDRRYRSTRERINSQQALPHELVVKPPRCSWPRMSSHPQR